MQKTHGLPDILRAYASQPGAPPSDEILLKRIAAGDKRAMDHLFRRHSVPVYRFVMRLTGDISMAEDTINGSDGDTLYFYAFNTPRKLSGGRTWEDEKEQYVKLMMADNAGKVGTASGSSPPHFIDDSPSGWNSCSAAISASE